MLTFLSHKWKSFVKNGNGSLRSYLQGGDNTLLGSSVANSDTGSIWSEERLVSDSSQLYANRCFDNGGAWDDCTSSGTYGSSDGDRIGSEQSSPSDNNGGGLGNWHDMSYCCSGQSYGGKSCNGSAFRTTTEAQATWNHAFGTDSYGAMTGTGNDSNCQNANWSVPSGYNYDYAIFFGQ